MKNGETETTLVIGVGNLFREDDAIGLIIARRLAELNLPQLVVEEQSGEGTALMHAWLTADQVIMIDAVQASGLPGTIYQFEANEVIIPRRFFNYSTHAFSVAEAIEMARVLDGLPKQMQVFGIEGKTFGHGQTITPEVEKAADEVIELILGEVQAY